MSNNYCYYTLRNFKYNLLWLNPILCLGGFRRELRLSNDLFQQLAAINKMIHTSQQ